MKMGIVIGEFHREIAEAMLKDAEKAAEQEKAQIEVEWVPGTYEAPLIVRKFLKRKDIDCVTVLGFIEKGETLHGEEMGQVTSLLFKQMELEYNKPVGMGIIGPGATEEQAWKRISYAGRAVKAALRMCDLIR